MKYLIIYFLLISIVILLFYSYYSYINSVDYISNIYDNKYNIIYKKFPDYNKIIPYNSSIIKDNDVYIVYTRVDSYDSFLNKNRNGCHLGVSIFNKDLEQISYRIDRFDISNIIIEDLRVFKWNGQKYFIGTIWDKNEFYPIILDSFYNIYYIDDNKGSNFKYNKNFSPLIYNDKLFLIINHNPLEIIEVKSIEKDHKNIVKTEDYIRYQYDKNMPNLRGSTPYINIGNNRYLGITHTLSFSSNLVNTLFNGRKIYKHFFTILNLEDPHNIYIEKNSKPICLLGDCGIEFVMGLEESFDDNNYIISFGKNDNKAYLISISKDKVKDYF